MPASAALLAALLTVQPTPVSAPVEPEPPNTVEGVEVRAKPFDREAEDRAIAGFVRDLSAATPREQLARWEGGAVCTAVAGLSERHGTYIADRIAFEALALGLEVGQPGCRPNIFIFFTSRANDTAAKFRAKAHRKFFGQIDIPGADRGGGSQSLKEFLTTPRPVRWWHVARKTATDHPPGSLVVPSWRDHLNRALIIVDTTQTRGVTYEALASYLAIGSLAQLKPDPEPEGVDSITTLFADRDAGRPIPESLTVSDRAYLRGLYTSSRRSKLGSQKGAIRRFVRQARSR